jgi:hypothetical protein
VGRKGKKVKFCKKGREVNNLRDLLKGGIKGS